VLLEQRAPLSFGHAAPDAELDLVVECVGEAFGFDRAIAAHRGGFALRRAANEEFVGIGGQA
jgi:hypothetical protein